VNYAGDVVELYWINTFDEPEVPGEINLVKQLDKPMRNSTEVTVS
jgi:hypothetical protein